MSLSVSPDQKVILEQLISWIKKPLSTYITVGGYAGTGKTTVIAIFRLLLKKHQSKTRVAFASYTGKASQVLKRTLESVSAINPGDFCGTLHSLLYTPSVNSTGQITSWRKTQKLEFDLIIIDEASMVTEDLWNDLLAYKVPVIAVGDHGQLPPIGDGFNLMQKPMIRLETIHRQAAESPIIALATLARTTGEIPFETFASNVKKIPKNSVEAQDLIDRYFGSVSSTQDLLVLCGFNNTRIKLNNHIRTLQGKDSAEPLVGDNLICLKNNYNATGGPIFNGMVGKLKKIYAEGKHWYQVEIEFLDSQQLFQGQISRYQFNAPAMVDAVDSLNYREIGDRFDFGYALTVHKAQGSQAETVMVFEERSKHWSDEDWRRWLYTAVTRASENLYLLG